MDIGSLTDVFRAQAHCHPESVAVTAGDQLITYGELDSASDKLARVLSAAGVGRDTLVGLFTDRSVHLIVGMLAILKAGGAYVAIDPDYPEPRIRLLIENSRASIVLSVAKLATRLRDFAPTIVLIDDDHEQTNSPLVGPLPCNLAYVCYTSGSTGIPKGVLIEHQHVIRLFDQTRQWFEFSPADVWTMVHSPSFDFSVWEIWGALLHGGRLVMVTKEVARSPARLKAALTDHAVTVFNTTPSAFRQFIAADLLSQPTRWSLRTIVFGGERLDVPSLAPWIDRYGDATPQLVNMYGITETTIHVTYHRVVKQDLQRPHISPIGVPIPDLQIHLINEAGEAVRQGEKGNIYVAGDGLARGYLARPDLTSERFVWLPAVDGGRTRLYHSGDLAVQLPNGDFAYIGRADDQIKVRGFRIEPREIEVCLSSHPEVSHVAVAPEYLGDGDARIVAFVVPMILAGDACLTGLPTRLTTFASENLPSHMRPAIIKLVTSLPITANGKLDRSALWGLTEQRLADARDGTGVVTSRRFVIQHIAEEILHRSPVGCDDDLFDLGATSITLMRLLTRVNSVYGTTLNGSELEDGCTVACLAQIVDTRLRAGCVQT